MVGFHGRFKEMAEADSAVSINETAEADSAVSMLWWKQLWQFQ
jgi:hypothetical protein